MNWVFFHQLASSKWFYKITNKWVLGLAIVSIPTLFIGLFWGMFVAPPDYFQGNSYRIIFVHVPAASLALSFYVGIALSSAVGFIWKIKMADIVARSMVPVGASFCFMALASGAIWGKPTWGTWWVWDARLTSMLILFFLYLGLIGLRNAIADHETASRACGLLAMVGVVNLPIIKYSVDWWNNLHQGATLSFTGKSSIAPEMLWPLLISISGFYLFSLFVVLLRIRIEILASNIKATWVRELFSQ